MYVAAHLFIQRLIHSPAQLGSSTASQQVRQTDKQTNRQRDSESEGQTKSQRVYDLLWVELGLWITD